MSEGKVQSRRFKVQSSKLGARFMSAHSVQQVHCNRLKKADGILGGFSILRESAKRGHGGGRSSRLDFAKLLLSWRGICHLSLLFTPYRSRFMFSLGLMLQWAV